MKIVRNTLAVVVGVFVCMFVNGGLIQVSALIVPPPDGVDMKDLESIKANFHLLQPKHFVMPLLAHMLGSLAGGFVAALIAASRKMVFALVIGFVHLLGGIVATFLIPAPPWFIATDLLIAYIPMACLGGILAGGRRAEHGRVPRFTPPSP